MSKMAKATKKWNQIKEASIYIDDVVNTPECNKCTPDSLKESGMGRFENNNTDAAQTPIQNGNSTMSHFP